jgi:hypothetical protein
LRMVGRGRGWGKTLVEETISKSRKAPHPDMIATAMRVDPPHRFAGGG